MDDQTFGRGTAGEGDGGSGAGDDATLATKIMELHPGRETSYTVRELRDGDSYRVAGMLGEVIGDDGIAWAASTGQQNMVMFAGVAALFRNAPREIQLFCADLIGIGGDRARIVREDEERQAREVRARREWAERRAEAEGKGPEALADFDRDNDEVLVYNLKNAKQIQQLVEEDVIKRFERYPPGTTQDIMSDVMERDDFVPFVTSSMRLYETGQKLFGRFSTRSSPSSGSPSDSS